jgi:hypothetical protein
MNEVNEMKNRFDIYDLELFNKICDAKDFPNIIGTHNNKLESLWCRNYKDVIKFETSIIIKGLEPNCCDSEEFLTNVYMDITPKQAEDIIKELQRVLKKRKK